MQGHILINFDQDVVQNISTVLSFLRLKTHLNFKLLKMFLKSRNTWHLLEVSSAVVSALQYHFPCPLAITQ